MRPVAHPRTADVLKPGHRLNVGVRKLGHPLNADALRQRRNPWIAADPPIVAGQWQVDHRLSRRELNHRRVAEWNGRRRGNLNRRSAREQNNAAALLPERRRKLNA